MSRVSRSIMLWLGVALVMSPWFSLAAAQDTLFRSEEIEQLVAPVALYPDSLLAQVLMASTYPLEIVAAARWVKVNPKLKDQARAMTQFNPDSTWTRL
jgi:Protein of unknown function (DUF3300)